jgi:hypothetical protein
MLPLYIRLTEIAIFSYKYNKGILKENMLLLAPTLDRHLQLQVFSAHPEC